MPRLNGFDVARQMRRMPGLAGLFILAVTGYGTADDRRKTQEAGFDLHLVKPVDVHDLARALGERISATLH